MARKCCFVVSIIGDEDSPDRVHADWFLEAIVRPVFQSNSDFIVERADKMSQPGLIDAQVIHKLLTAELVVADLSGRNPNVFYEIGIRHMAQKPIIHMHEVGEQIPFDVSLYRSIAYSRARPRDLNIACDQLRRAVEAALSADHEVENPVTNARGRFKLEEHATSEQKVVIDQLRGIEERLARIEKESLPRQYGSDSPPTPSMNRADYVSYYSAGDAVHHVKFGDGVVSAVDGSKLTVTFDSKWGVKKVIDQFVVPRVPSRKGSGARPE